MNLLDMFMMRISLLDSIWDILYDDYDEFGGRYNADLTNIMWHYIEEGGTL